MIIDSHAHIGYDEIADLEIREEELVRACDENKIDGAIVQPLINRPYLEDTRAINNRIHALCDKYPGRFWGMTSINPHFRPEDYDAEAERCFRQYGFVGMKIAPNAHGVNPAKKNGMHVFEVAHMYNVAVMVHTGSGAPLSDPMTVLPAAQQFTDVRIILAHAGGELMTAQAIYLAKTFDNVYLEPSWQNILALKGMLRAVGPSKIMFSSDIPDNIPIELLKYRLLTNDTATLERLFSGTAQEVFRIG